MTTRRAPRSAEPPRARPFAWATSRRAFPWLVLGVVVLGIVARLPDAALSTEIIDGHPDANTYFNAAHVVYQAPERENRPLPHGGSGWPLLLGQVLRALGLEPGTPLHRYDAWPADAKAYYAYQGLEGVALQDAYLAGFGDDTVRAVRVAYATSAALAAGVVAATFVLARLVTGRGAALAAAALVAVDPALATSAGDAMSEPAFMVAATLAFAAAVAASRARIGGAVALSVVAGGLMALAYSTRFNGLVLALAVVGVAVLPALRWPRPDARRVAAVGAAFVVAFAAVAAPYWSWRAEHLPGPLHMGQNGDVWADAFWVEDSYSDPSGDHYHRYRTFDEYRENHTAGDAALRLWQGAWWQARDFVKQASLPVLAVGAFAAWRFARDEPRRRARLEAFAFAPLAALVTFAPLVWVYPLVASLRYFHPLTPLIVVAGAAAVAGWAREKPERAAPVAWATVAVVAAYALPRLWAAPAGVAWAFAHPEVATVALSAAILFGGAVAVLAWRDEHGAS